MGIAVLFRMSPASGRLWLLGLAMLMAQFSISALNDWADHERDREAERARPLPLGIISPRAALGTAVGSAAVAVLVALGLGILPALLLMVGVAAGWAYDLIAKATPLSAVPFALAFPLLPAWVGVVAGEFPRAWWALILGGVPIAAAIHLADAIPDIQKDAAAGLRTLAATLGPTVAGRVAVLGLLLGGAALALDSGPLRPPVGLIALAGGLFYQLLRNKWILIGGAVLAVLTWLAW
jgi:4-hydroxybenzoate polyprenyltransferase